MVTLVSCCMVMHDYSLATIHNSCIEILCRHAISKGNIFACMTYIARTLTCQTLRFLPMYCIFFCSIFFALCTQLYFNINLFSLIFLSSSSPFPPPLQCFLYWFHNTSFPHRTLSLIFFPPFILLFFLLLQTFSH